MPSPAEMTKEQYLAWSRPLVEYLTGTQVPATVVAKLQVQSPDETLYELVVSDEGVLTVEAVV